jgi:hypothetical protein
MDYLQFFFIKVKTENVSLFHKYYCAWYLLEILEKILHSNLSEYGNLLNDNSFMKDEVGFIPFEYEKLVLLLLVHH